LVHWAVLWFAAEVSGCYVGWLVLFERWLEPRLRRCGGAIIGSAIVRVPAVGPFRIWGLRERRSRAMHASVGLLGAMTVLFSALLPTAALVAIAARARADNATIAASGYLISLPMIALFALRALLAQGQGAGSHLK
jgi:hypothetical protein